MSRCMLSPLRFYRTTPGLQHFLPTFARACLFASDSSSTASGNGANGGGGKGFVRNTTILVQQGCDIQELPVVVRKVAEDEFVALISNKVIDNQPTPPIGQSVATMSHSEGNVSLEEKAEAIDACQTAAGVCSVVEALSEQEFFPEIAVRAMEKILRVETLLELKGLEGKPHYEQIINCIIFRGDNETVLNVLDGMRNYMELAKTIDMLGNELVYRCSENKLTIEQCCEAVEILTQCKRYEMAEKFWSGIADQEKQINDKNVHQVFAILPYLKISRKAVLNILERRIPSVWWQMTANGAMDVLQSLEACKISPFRITQTFARWLNTNIHAVTEAQLEAILESFNNLSYSDNQIERSMARYVKAKGVKIKSQSLIVTMLRHCQLFRLRNPDILNGCSEFFIANHQSLDPGYLRAVLCPFGWLDFQTVNSNKFWETMDMFLDLNFTKIHPMEIIDIMFCYVTLEKYPLNFVNRIFNPYFLDVLHARTRPEQLDRVRSMLKVFDTSLALECPDYDGPLLPRDHSAKSVFHDGRIKRIVNFITPELEELAGGPGCMTKFTILQHLPMNELYLVDVLLHPSGMGNIFSLNTMKERNINVALLIHLPEYYNSTGEYLIGPQAMRIRQLRRLGLKVVTLKFDVVYKLKVHPKELRKYLVERLKEAMEALPPPKSGLDKHSK
ncbi:FAST kinase domain-containing protein 3, mitochondrial-like [Toxorhynchites rutilus septentrionalis]|uniref:FAST kinase domain-containing protein 3, mitochondrial-like n=1 Tax=Toxorhynchites rutilus septentrionalis TaxID=329112 RepID=UPI0024786868|nr:FAST kinase domain-containing protein 3, mitochondrial-like [Toxorhynchites rutilus septentrionalis]